MIKINKPAAFCAAAVLAANLLCASAAAPGGPDDPVVTKSYVDEQIKAALGSLTDNPAETAADNAAFTPVFAAAGQYVIGHEGAEIILRSGLATARCPGEDGVTNVTQGADLPDGARLSANNLIIIPRYDGRGVKAETDAWFLVKGGYDIRGEIS
ncbi:MAG: hypothetical protein LBL35_01190 [Clostridiales bacterium]|jgi:hypothetical protein|nr:hypothetical protein [Clostridiales bacterium]